MMDGDYELPPSFEDFWRRYVPISDHEPDLLMRMIHDAILDLRKIGLDTSCIEPVWKDELWVRFFTKASQNLESTPQYPDGLKFRYHFQLAYHGPGLEDVQRIIDHGFQTLDESGRAHQSHSVRLGGRGIWVTPDVLFACRYGQHKTVIVCAVASDAIPPWEQDPNGDGGFDGPSTFRPHITCESTTWVVWEPDLVPLCVLRLENTQPHHYLARSGQSTVQPEEIPTWIRLYEQSMTEKEAERMTKEENFPITFSIT